MDTVHYIGFDVHKKTITICVKNAVGKILEEETILSTRSEICAWIARHKTTPWIGGMEATIFTGWIYDLLKPAAKELKVGHPMMMRAIAASKKKNDRLDAKKIADLVRADLLPECYMAPQHLRDLRRELRYRTLMVHESVRLKNRMAGLLMETGVEYVKSKLHYCGYFEDLARALDHDKEVPGSVVQLLRISRTYMRQFESTESLIVNRLTQHPELNQRVERLMTIPGVGSITALTWALETVEVGRFSSIAKAHSYCGLTSAQNSSAGKDARGPISKQRNKHLQSVLIEASKLAPRFNPALKLVYEEACKTGNANRATIAVARKLVAFLMAVDKSGKDFELRLPPTLPAEQTLLDSGGSAPPLSPQ